MGKSTRSLAFIGIWLAGILGLGSLTALAQAGKDGVVTINGGRQTLFLKSPSRSNIPSAPLPPGVVTIYSNLGKGDQTYNAMAGSGIVGKNAGQPYPQEVGTAFIPKAGHTVQAIRVGASYVQGTNQIVVTLNEDDNDLPGKVLHTWKFSNLPVFGTCCTLQTGVYRTGIPVKANTQYWVVLRTTGQGTDTFAVWNDNYQGIQGRWANSLGYGWWGSYQVLESFGVYGK